MPAISLKNRVFLRRVPATASDQRAGDAVDWQTRWIVVFLAVGVALRLIRYLLRFPLWGDETLLAVNFLDRDYAGLMRPLDHHQVAPLLFLWTELTAVKLLGFHEWSLRLLPLLSGIASLFLFHRLARHLLRGTALVLAVAIFAVTFSGIRYACEAKPYGVDLMVSTLILLLTVRWWRQPDQTRWLWGLTAVMPIALGLSFPAVFVAGGASVVVMVELLRARPRRGWSAWLALNVVLVASFLGWYWFGIRVQSQAELGVMSVCWDGGLAPRDSLVNLVVWLVQSQAGPILAVPVGGENWGSSGTLLLCLVAAVVLLRQARYRVLLLCAGPFALNLAAAVLRRYPYGGHMRLAMHMVPIVSILAAIGAAALLHRLGRRRSNTEPLASRASKPRFVRLDGLESPPYAQADPIGVSVPVAVAIGLLLALALAITARDCWLPGKEQQEIRRRDFAVWFWGSMERGHEVVCTSSDLPSPLPALEVPGRGSPATQFVCNRRIYSPQEVRGQRCDLSRVSRQRPLACVQYWSHVNPSDPAPFGRWLDAMKQQYDLVGTSRYPMLQDNDHDRLPEPANLVEVYEFVPKG